MFPTKGLHSSVFVPFLPLLELSFLFFLNWWHDYFLDAESTAQDMFWAGDMEALSAMVTPRVVGAYKRVHTEMMEKRKNKGNRLNNCCTKVETATLVDFEFAFEDDGKGRYGLPSCVPQLDGYHNDTFLVLSVHLYVEHSAREYSKEGNYSLVRDKRFSCIKLGRQIPKIVGFRAPVKEFKSPWFIVDVQYE